MHFTGCLLCWRDDQFPSCKAYSDFYYPAFALPLREAIRANAYEIAKVNGVEIEHINKSHIRKEEVVAKVQAKRGDHPGLVHIIRLWKRAPLTGAIGFFLRIS